MAETPTQEQFWQLLSGLLQTDNDVRQQAEKTYESYSNETKFQLLWSVVAQTNVEADRWIMAAVLLRKLLTNSFADTYAKLNVEAQNQFKCQILMLLSQEQDLTRINKICGIIEEVVENLMSEGSDAWPEFLQFLFESVSGTTTQIIAGLTLFSACPTVLRKHNNQTLMLMKSMLVKCMASDVTQVQDLAAKALICFIIDRNEDANIQKGFQDILPPLLKIVEQVVEHSRDDEVLKSMVELAEEFPKFLRPHVEDLFNFAIKTISHNDIEDNYKHLVLEIIVTLAESAAAMVRKSANKCMGAFIPALLKMMTEIEDEDNWTINDNAQDDDDNESSAVVAESSLDRLACCLSGKTILPYVNSSILQMLQSEDWKYRHAALMAISAIGEGCHKQMESSLQQIVEVVMRYVTDPHPRVRYAACNAIGQMATDFSNVFPKKFHSSIVPGLLHVMDDVANPRVQAHACAALVNFCEACPKDTLTTYLPAIIAKLEGILLAKFKELMESGNKLVLEQIVTTIASVADAAEEHFIEYYDRFTPCLMYIIENANVDGMYLLRGKTIECVSLMGLAVGEEKFMEDAAKMMDILLKAQVNQAELADDDPQISYLISAWARICKIMGRQFEQYLPLVMGPVLKTAAIKPEVALLDNDDLNTMNDEDEWQFVSIGEEQNFGIRTAGLEDKATACQMLVCYARELKAGFADYTEQTVKLMVPMLKFYFHDGVRSAAAESLPYLLDCAKIKGPQYLSEMWNYICPELIKAVDTEPESEVMAEHIEALGKCIEVLGAGCITEDQIKDIIRIIDQTLVNYFSKVEARHSKRRDEDYDEVVEEKLKEEDEEDTYMLSKVTEVIHAFFTTYRSQFLPFFDQLLPHIERLIQPHRVWSDNQWGLCIFDDVIEFCGPGCMPYTKIFLQPLLQYVSAERPEVRQAASYGCGLLAQFGGPEFSTVCSQVMSSLIQVIQSPQSRDDDNANATENAISAVTKILKYQSSAVNVNEILPLWLSWLPVTEDLDEVVHIYGYLCDLIDSNNPIVLGPDNANLPKLVAIFAEAYKMKTIEKDSEIAGRMLNIVRQLQANPTMFQACVNELNHEQQVALHSFMSP